jgi:hypothetical protein
MSCIDPLYTKHDDPLSAFFEEMGTKYHFEEKERRLVMYGRRLVRDSFELAALVIIKQLLIPNTLSFHAAGVSFGNQGILIAGPSHSGKTEIALSLVARGGRFLGDEFIFMRFASDRSRILGVPLRPGIWKGQGAEWVPVDLRKKFGTRIDQLSSVFSLLIVPEYHAEACEPFIQQMTHEQKLIALRSITRSLMQDPFYLGTEEISESKATMLSLLKVASEEIDGYNVRYNKTSLPKLIKLIIQIKNGLAE